MMKGRLWLTIRENINYPITLDSAVEIMRILSIIRKESAFA